MAARAAAQLPYTVGAEVTLVALLRGNMRLIERVPESVVRACLARGRKARYLAPLHEMLRVDGIPVKRSQQMVLKCMLDVPGAMFLGVTGKEAADLDNALADNPNPAGGGLVSGGLPEYHIAVLRVIVLACAGTTRGTVAKCQALVPLGDTIARSLVLKDANHVRTKAALLDVLRVTFIDGDWPFSSDDASRLLMDLAGMLKDAVAGARGAGDAAWTSAIYDSVLPCLIAAAALPVMGGVLAGGPPRLAAGELVRLAPQLVRRAPSAAAHATAAAMPDVIAATLLDADGGGAAAAAAARRSAAGTITPGGGGLVEAPPGAALEADAVAVKTGDFRTMVQGLLASPAVEDIVENDFVRAPVYGPSV